MSLLLPFSYNLLSGLQVLDSSNSLNTVHTGLTFDTRLCEHGAGVGVRHILLRSPLPSATMSRNLMDAFEDPTYIIAPSTSRCLAPHFSQATAL